MFISYIISKPLECVLYTVPYPYAASLQGVLNERVSQTSAVATRSQPPKPASLRDAGFAAPCGGAGIGFSLPVCGSVQIFD